MSQQNNLNIKLVILMFANFIIGGIILYVLNSVGVEEWTLVAVGFAIATVVVFAIGYQLGQELSLAGGWGGFAFTAGYTYFIAPVTTGDAVEWIVIGVGLIIFLPIGMWFHGYGDQLGSIFSERKD